MATLTRKLNPITPSMGVYLATVASSADVNRSGRLDVQIPALQTVNDQSDRSIDKTTYTVRYCSPFAGQTPARDAKVMEGSNPPKNHMAFGQCHQT